MKRLITLIFALLLFCALSFSQIVLAEGFQTDFDAFKIGDPNHAVATFKLLGEEKTLSVWELKEMLQQLGYGKYFANDLPQDGYTLNVGKAFKEYVESYEERLKAAEAELNKANPVTE